MFAVNCLNWFLILLLQRLDGLQSVSNVPAGEQNYSDSTVHFKIFYIKLWKVYFMGLYIFYPSTDSSEFDGSHRSSFQQF